MYFCTKLGNVLTIPEIYQTEGTIGDIGIVVGNEFREDVEYIAKSLPCALLKSNNRPIWGIMVFNNAFLKYDQHGFQNMLFVAIH